MTPRMKNVAWQRDGDELQLVYDVRSRFVITDPEGTVDVLLELLRDGGRTVPQLVTELACRGRTVSAEEVDAAVQLLDSYGLVEDEDRLGRFSDTSQERYFSNLAFFESFATIERSREDYQQQLRDAHVLVLGTGGLNSNTIPHLCGLGVGRLTLLDRDVVEPRNFARQYLYRKDDLGARKVRVAADWVRAFDPAIKVEAFDQPVNDLDDLGSLLERAAPDVVMSGVDSPREVDSWVNHACVSRGVPFVRGGVTVTLGAIFSVDPGNSACYACTGSPLDAIATGAAGGAEAEIAAYQLSASLPQPNRAIGPVAGLLGALSAFEVLRYLTRFEPPAYAGRPLLIDFAGGCATSQPPAWRRNPSCTTCAGGAPSTEVA